MDLYVFETASGLRAYWRGKHATIEAARIAIQRELERAETVTFVERIK